MPKKRQSTPPVDPKTTKRMSTRNFPVESSVEDEFYETNDKLPENEDNDVRDLLLSEAMSQTSLSSKASSSAFARENTFGGQRRGKMRNLIEIDI